MSCRPRPHVPSLSRGLRLVENDDAKVQRIIGMPKFILVGYLFFDEKQQKRRYDNDIEKGPKETNFLWAFLMMYIDSMISL